LKFGQVHYPAIAVTWSPDGHYVAAITYADVLLKQNINPASQVGIWDAKSGQEVQTIPTVPNPQVILTALAWSPAPTSTQLAAGSRDGKVYIWNVNPQLNVGNSEPARTLAGVNAEIEALAWSVDGHWLAAGYNDAHHSILIWKL
jgi:WD40 repeat protein